MRMLEKEYAKAMSPNACRLRHTFCVELTPTPMLIPVRLPWIPPLAANSQLITIVWTMPRERPMPE
uniref:Uncharacterized protein n=1 Tax=Oryza rufipogon TaxID=4529 RepID=A0A0E0REM5_ORYRU